MKAILNLGYKEFVLDVKDAVTVAELLGKAELYESKWAKDNSTHHIYEQEEITGRIHLLPDATYKMYKMAGKPVKE